MGVADFNAQIALKTDVGFATANGIGKALTQVVPANIACSASDVSALNTVKAAVVEAKAVAEKVVIEKQIEIKAAIDTINKAIATILEVNSILVSSGLTAFADPGTTLATVTAPTLPPTEAPASGPEATTPEAGAGATTPEAGPGATTPEAGPAATTPEAGPGATTPEAGPGATTPDAGAGATTPEAGAGTTTPEAGAGATTPGGGAESTPPSPQISTANPGGRKFFGKRSRGSIL